MEEIKEVKKELKNIVKKLESLYKEDMADDAKFDIVRPYHSKVNEVLQKINLEGDYFTNKLNVDFFRYCSNFNRQISHYLPSFIEDLNSIREQLKTLKFPKLKKQNKLKELNYLIHCSMVIRDSKLDEQIRFHIIFSDFCSRKINTLIQECDNNRFNYYDPDTSYEEDLCAFVNALETQYIQEERLKTLKISKKYKN